MPTDPSNDAEEAVSAEPVALDFVAHLAATEAELEPGEIALVRKAVGQMKPQTLIVWRERLLQLRPAEAPAAPSSCRELGEAQIDAMMGSQQDRYAGGPARDDRRRTW